MARVEDHHDFTTPAARHPNLMPSTNLGSPSGRPRPFSHVPASTSVTTAAADIAPLPPPHHCLPSPTNSSSPSSTSSATNFFINRQNRHSYQVPGSYGSSSSSSVSVNSGGYGQSSSSSNNNNLYLRQQYSQAPYYSRQLLEASPAATVVPFNLKENIKPSNAVTSGGQYQQQQQLQYQQLQQQQLQLQQSLQQQQQQQQQPQTHHRSKSSVLRSLLHRRNPSNNNAPTLNIPLDQSTSFHAHYNTQPNTPNLVAHSPQPSPSMMFASVFGGGGGSNNNNNIISSNSNNTTTTTNLQTPNTYVGPLEELPQNAQDALARSPRKSGEEPRTRSPTKLSLSGFGLMSSKDSANKPPKGETSPARVKKTKSSTNLAALLRPKSSKNLRKQAAADAMREAKDKENRCPSMDSPEMRPGDFAPPPPIYAEFCADAVGPARSSEVRATSLEDMRSEKSGSSLDVHRRVTGTRSANPSMSNLRCRAETGGSAKMMIMSRTQRGTKVLSAIAALGGGGGGSAKTKTSRTSSSNDSADTMAHIDPKDIDRHLEEMLDRRNIPENQRYKMRNLNKTIKTEFIRQDWAEMSASRGADRPATIDGHVDAGAPTAMATLDEDGEDARGGGGKEKTKRNRGRSFTLGRSNKDKDKEGGGSGGGAGGAAAAKKNKGETVIGRHFRSKSTESLSAGERPLSIESSSGGGLLSKIKLQQCPADFVAYLRKVQKPEVVEVGKLHKLRLLLRNETVSWTDEFIAHGGMKEIVGLLNRIMEIEWREEHEDALLHESLLCLKALCTTALALEYLHSIQADLFPKLLHMIFDPEKKGPSEFTTRNIITSVLFTYIQSATPHERESRARTVLGHLRDPTPKEQDRPVPFVLDMRRDRPFKIWCKEAVGVSKEVFWIFLHHLNIIALPPDRLDSSDSSRTGDPESHTQQQQQQQQHQNQQHQQQLVPQSRPAAQDPYAYMSRHFPQERPPVPAAPYVGGVEWDATNYLASHLDLLNAIIACTPGVDARNDLRDQLRVSGWERCLGGSLRLCKEKFYGSIHDGLRTWVAAAAEDGWDVRHVRYGPPPPDVRASSPKKTAPAGQKKAINPIAPKIDIPGFSIGLGETGTGNDAGDSGWMS